MNVRRFNTYTITLPLKNKRSRRRQQMDIRHFQRECLVIMRSYETLLTRYGMLQEDFDNDLITEQFYIDRFKVIMEQYKELLSLYGDTITAFVSDQADANTPLEHNENKVENILNLYGLLQKNYGAMRKFFDITLSVYYKANGTGLFNKTDQ